MRYTYTLMPKSGEGLILYNTASAAEGSFLTNCSIFLGMFSSSCSSCMEKPGEVATFNYNLLIFLEELRLGSLPSLKLLLTESYAMIMTVSSYKAIFKSLLFCLVLTLRVKWGCPISTKLFWMRDPHTSSPSPFPQRGLYSLAQAVW